MRNPYQVLGVSPQSGPDEIKAAYRRLAKTYHPDSGGTDAKSQARFYEVTSAYELLQRKDATQRANAARTAAYAAQTARPKQPDAAPKAKPEARPEPKPEAKPEAEKSGPKQTSDARRDAGSASHSSPDDAARNNAKSETFAEPRKPVFADFLNQIKSAGRRALGGRNSDHVYEVNIPFSDAVIGTKRRVTLQNGKSLDVHVPAGVEDGQQIRLRGQGAVSLGAREAGDAFVSIAIAPHPVFKREGADIHVNVAVSLPEAILGSKINVPTIDGDVQVTVPEGSNSGSILRLKGKGLPFPPGKRRMGRGDQYVTLTLVLPDKIDDQLKDFAATWAPGLQHRPRKV
ncbi:MAG: DnaJ C-terminal domain-containing protein [Parvibaculum sp.]